MNKLSIVSLQLLTGDQYETVDIDRSTGFPFNLQVSELSNPSVTKIPYSTQISLPRTKTNNRIFSQIWRLDHAVTDTAFNPLTRTDFRLYINNNLYQSGYIKLEEITASYKIRLYGGLGDYFYSLSELKLKDLDFGNAFEHTINAGFIKKCWDGNSGIYDKTETEDGYKGDEILSYAMCYQGDYDNFDSDSVVDNDGEPDAVRWYNEKMTHNSPALNEHKRTEKFNNTVFFGEYRSYYQRPLLRLRTVFRKIVSHMQEEEEWTTELDETFFNPHNPYWRDLWLLCPPYDTTSDMSGVSLDYHWKNKSPKSEVIHDHNMNGKRIQLETGYTEEMKVKNDYQIDVRLSFKLLAIHKSGTKGKSQNKTFPLSIGAEIVVGGLAGSTVKERLRYTLNGSESIELNTDTVHGATPSDYPNNNFYYTHRFEHKDERKVGSVFTLSKSVKIPASLIGNNTPTFEIFFIIDGSTYWYRLSNGDKMRNFAMQIELQEKDSHVIISEDKGGGLRTGSKVNYEHIVRSEASCLDFFTSYCKLFGLYYLKDPNRKKVSIVTRNTFFGEQKRLDWTQKLDRSQEPSLKPVPFDHKTGILKWKDLGTKYEEEFLSQTSKEYGSKRIHTGYEFNDTEKNYIDDNIFGNCTIATGYSQYFIDRNTTVYKDNKTLPYLQDKAEKRVDADFVLLFKDKPKTVNTPFLITDDNDNMLTYGYGWTTHNAVLSYTYPTLLRTIPIKEESYSLHFGAPGTYYNDEEKDLLGGISEEETITLYGRFWKRYLKDRFDKTNKMLTASFDLNLTDIQQELFNKFIHINDTVWVVNKIYNFDPVSPKPTKVELISVLDPNNYVSQQYIAGNFSIKWVKTTGEEPIYDSTDNDFPSNRIGIRLIERGPTSVLLRISSSIKWQIRNLPEGVTASPSSTEKEGTDVPVTISLPKNDSDYLVNHNIQFRWGNTTTILQIAMIYKWTITASTNFGIVYINELATDTLDIENGEEATLNTTANESLYGFAYWTINNQYYYEQEVRIPQVLENYNAEARWYDKSTHVKMACSDNNTTVYRGTVLQGKMSNFWLLELGEYNVRNSQQNLSGYLFGEDKLFTNPAAEVKRTLQPTDEKLTVYYDTLLAHIHIDNKSHLPFSSNHLQIKYGETSVGNISGSVAAHTQDTIRFVYANAATGTYKMTASQQAKQYISISNDTFDYQLPATTIHSFQAFVESIGWENDGPFTTGADENRVVTNTLFVPSGMRYEIRSSMEDITISPRTGNGGTIAVTFTMGINEVTSGRHCAVTASIYKGNELIKECNFTIVQDAGRPIGWETPEFHLGAEETEIKNKLTIPSGGNFYLLSPSGGILSASAGQGYSSMEITFTVSENNSADERIIEVTANIYDAENNPLTPKTFTIYQAGKNG